MDDRGRDRDTENTVPEPVWMPGPANVPAGVAVKLFEGLPDEIRQIVLDLIKQFIPEIVGGLTARYHDFINTTVLHNIQAFNNDRLAELAGYVNAEVNRRAG